MIKKLLFALLFLTTITLSAQTSTYNLNWFSGIGSSVDLTIEEGDTVIWTWTSPSHTVENDPAGTSVETFNSGFLGATGSTFSFTFNTIGSNDYYCSVHGAASMSGTITVASEGSLSVQSFEDVFTKINVHPNPASTEVNIDIPGRIIGGVTIEVYDLLGKQIVTKEANALNNSLVITNWNNGVYLMKIFSNTSGKSVTKRFVKI